MARRYDFYFPVGDGENKRMVGYSLTERDGYFGIRFIGPDGKRFEKMTRCRRKDENLTLEAAKIIATVYAPVYIDPKKVTWEDALDEVERTAPDLRPATMVAYRKAVRVVRATLEVDPRQTTGPFDVTAEVATRFARVWLSGKFKRSKASDAKEYKRSPTTLAFYLRQLSALWAQFKELGYVRDNPWQGVRKPTTEKKKKPVPTEADIDVFFTWVKSRYPQWERLPALLELKALSGCRTSDICQLRTNQLREGRIIWDASQTKHKEGRAVLLPPELFVRLQRLAGPHFLWEHFVTDLKQFRKSRNRSSDVFDTKTVFWVVNNIFREFNEEHPERVPLQPHSLRRRAITLVAMATGSMDATAQAIGINPTTARNYYLDAQRAFNADEVFRKVSGVLLPKSDQPGPH